VLSIFMTEYYYANDMAVLKEDAYEDGLFVGREEVISIGLERGLEQGRATGREEGAYQTKLETAKTMISIGLPEEQIQLCTNLPLETIRDLIQPEP
ncbi:MAG: hypothetical protein IJ441_09910, partial [Spirochaetaceae bacterium]|nr:hypothetical protein [Spirochaetaceae bacterium]